MTRPFLALSVSLAVLALTGAAPSPDETFKALYSKEWAWREPQQAGGEDSTKIMPAFPDVSAAAQAKKLAYLTDVKAQLGRIDPRTLSPKAQVDYAVYASQIDVLISQLKFREYEKPLNADSSFWGDIGYVARGAFKSEQDYRNYISLLNDLPRHFDQQTENMRAGLKRGFTPPKITLEGRDSSITSVSQAKSPQDTVFWEPFKAMPSTMAPALQAELKAQAEAAIRGKVIPAYAKLLPFFRDEYVPRARTALAGEALPNGKAYYQALIKEFVTTDMTADQIHQIGLKEMASIRAEMLEAMKEAKFDGDLPAFLKFLRTDPQFYAKTPEQLLKEAAWISKEVDAKIGNYIGHLPRQRFAVIPVPDDIAPFYTSGRGGPGVYLVNTYNLPARPMYSLRALTLHESAPGHAFQMPLANENQDQPDFRRKVYISAYGEGWALYCERLGVEMGMYPTPYDKFGMLSYQAWRAARLVVDTGIHSKGWTREQARQYLHDNTALADHEIGTEVDRYIAWPGQALSYYMGQMAIREGRAKAEKALGPKFNIRAFHDTVLELGSVPLPVLNARIDKFIADGGVGPYPDEEK